MQYCISKLYRLQGTYIKMTTYLEKAVGKLRRVVGPPPDATSCLTLQTVCEVLFSMSSSGHRRKNGKFSQQYMDLQCAIEMFNGDLNGKMIHHCWDPESQSPCCSSHAVAVDKALRAAVDSMFGTADPIPGES
eukprot:5872900-Pyramimonas_sp.AAC.1